MEKKDLDVMFSHKNDDWSTPQEFYDTLDREFHFDIDVCADATNAKCTNYWTIDDNGLDQDWGGHTCFCNPPYSDAKEWVRKAYEESQKPGTTIVLLIPARTDTRYFHNYIYHKAEIRFVKGRLKFGGSKNSAPFPSMVVIYRSVD